MAEFNTPASREGIVKLVDAVPPILQGLAGKPVNVGTLGGYLQYKYGTFFPLIVSLWSILALSATLAAEARRGSLEFVAATALSRRRIALEKLFGHLAGLTIAVLVVFVSLLIVGVTVQGLPGRRDPGIVGGRVRDLAGAARHRRRGPGVRAGAVRRPRLSGRRLRGGHVRRVHRQRLPGRGARARAVGQPHVVGLDVEPHPAGRRVRLDVAVCRSCSSRSCCSSSASRRSRVVTSARRARSPRRACRASLVGLRGPAGRAFGQSIPSSLAWGLGIGIFGFAIAGSGGSFIEELGKSPEFVQLLSTIFPGFDIASVGGFLQLLFVEFGMILVGLAAATLVAVWASDETSGRLEFLLATPLSRVRWVTSGGAALIVAAVVITALIGRSGSRSGQSWPAASSRRR